MVGVTGVAIMRYEKGQRKVKNELLMKIAEECSVPISSLADVDLSIIPTEDLIAELKRRGE